MIEQRSLHDQGQAVESGFKINETIKSESTEQQNFNQNDDIKSVENDSFSEQSYEIISFLKSEKSSSSIMNSNDDEQTPTLENTSKAHKPRTSSETSSNSTVQNNRPRKSTSFLARLQSSSEDQEESNAPIFPSGIASAFSSFSSFTSNFTLNPSSSTSTNNGNISTNSSTLDNVSTSTTNTSRLDKLIETKEEIFNKKAALERKNLINLTKLIVKDLISTSLLSSRTINDSQNAVHLNNYFTLIDRVLKHGLKQNLLSNRSTNLWNALDSLPKYLKESSLMSESVKSLANTKTPDGKIKAWLRLVMMQKKLPEYFNELIANKNVLLKDIYHHYAFMVNDEAHVFAGLIIGVNVIDCNFFVKDANFDLMDDIIDLSPYLKVPNNYDSDLEESVEQTSNQVDVEKLTAVLDQKNYLEEWNKRLEATTVDLRARIKSLEEQNSKLEMEAKVNEVRINKLLETTSDKHNSGSSFTETIKNFIGNSEQLNNSNKLIIETGPPYSDQTLVDEDKQNLMQHGESSKNEKDPHDVNENDQKSSNQEKKSIDSKAEATNELLVTKNTELLKQLTEQEKDLCSLKERTSILESSYRGSLEKIKLLERDLDVQTSMNADKETTIKIYEKDIREKQAQVESLRTSINDAKKLNTDLSERLNDISNKLKDRVKSVSTLQASLDKWKLENKTLSTRLQDKQLAFKSVTAELDKATKTIEDLKRYNEKINEELKRERQSGHSSSVTVETQNARISELTEMLEALKNELKDVKPYRDQTEELSRRCRDYELSLEEIGSQLRESRLEVENLKENSAVYLDSQWMDSKQVKNCALCQQLFSVTRRKHHCRLCGNVFCQPCSDNKMELASSAKPVRVCDTCHSFLLAKFVKSST